MESAKLQQEYVLGGKIYREILSLAISATLASLTFHTTASRTIPVWFQAMFGCPNSLICPV